MIHVTDLHRELRKIEDVLGKVSAHLNYKDNMNAALHMSDNVHPTPLASAVSTSCVNLNALLDRLSEGVDNTPS